MALGGICIAVIFIWVAVAGSWSRTPDLIQLWGSILRLVSDIPIIGNFSLIIWGIFLLPGFLILQLGKKSIKSSIPTGNKNIKKKSVLIKNKHPETKVYTVYIDDNFHYQNEDERYKQGEYDTKEEAINVCRKIVDDCLSNAFKPGMTEKELYESYTHFGEDPFIDGGGFSAWNYAKERCKVVVDEDITLRKSVEEAYFLWREDTDRTYGKILRNSEIFEDEVYIHFCVNKEYELVASWHKKSNKWENRIQRNELDGLLFSTPKRLDDAIFSPTNSLTVGDNEDIVNLVYRRKNFLNEFCLFGIADGTVKTLEYKEKDGRSIHFSIDSGKWNNILLGNETVTQSECRIEFTNKKTPSFSKCRIFANSWKIILALKNEDGNFDIEMEEISIKDLSGYYS